MQNPGEETYETTDIHLAAYLSLAGCVLARRRRLGARVFFVFTNSGGPISSLREDYYANRAMVSAHRFAQEIQSYKQLCFDHP
jgi:hypothetical protein